MKKITILLFTVFFASDAYSQADINRKMNLLDQNVKNSGNNFNQFKDNFNISVKNFNEATRVINELRSLKKQALRDTKRAKLNSLVYGQVIGKYNEFIAAEEANILKEEEAIKKLEKLVESIKANTHKRRELIVTYSAEIKNAEAEAGVWKGKQREVTSVIKDIDEREDEALEERSKWMEKKEIYKKETGKWSKEFQKAKKTLLTFEKIRD